MPVKKARLFNDDDRVREIVKEEIENHFECKEHRFSRAGHPWTKEEDQKLASEFFKAVDEISVQHFRSTNSILARIRKILENDYDY